MNQPATGSPTLDTQPERPARPARPALGLVAMIVGVVGAVACAALIILVLVGRTNVQDRVDALAQDAVAALDVAVSVSEDALAGLATGAAEAAEVRVAAEELAANPSIDELAISALQQRLAPLSERYQVARVRYVELREKATNLMSIVDRIDRLLPGVELPGGPRELVAGMDERLVALDTAITDLSARAADRTGTSETATIIAQGAASLEAGIVAATEVTQNVQDELTGMQSSVDDLSDRIESLIGLGSWVVVLLLAWVALLHLALFALGRRWRAA